ncbi:hypothetical protein [Mesorhizobium sp. B1-1-7]|uniref:hypothetical protein n=1 Tax=Mesorhizobium sp. B1-1-7 TaxID=2589977 RepID=UPI00112EEB19|nr:hypothetical protein [Mesorhizobium sp. B1-1-7]TPN48668.1 hypothetical protein FJ978_20080 [Mesorhizobium sp. B1-1-7]
MKSGWELKFEDQRWASGVSGATVLLLSAFIYPFFSQADANFATAFSRIFSLKVDLGLCSSSFANLIMAQIAYALAICLVLLGFVFALGVAAIADATSRMRYLKLALGTLVLLLIFLALAMKDDGLWLDSTTRRSISAHLSIVDACTQSHSTDFLRVYVMSAWLFVGSWIAITVDIIFFRIIYFKRNYSDLPKDPAFRAEILAIHAKYGAVHRPIQKPPWTFSLMAFVGFLLFIAVHSLYKLAAVLGVL